MLRLQNFSFSGPASDHGKPSFCQQPTSGKKWPPVGSLMFSQSSSLLLPPIAHLVKLGCNHWQLVRQHPAIGKATPAFTKGQPDAKYLSGLNCSLRSQRQRQRGRPALFPSLNRAPIPLFATGCPLNLFRMPNYYAFRWYFAQKIASTNITQLPELFIFRYSVQRVAAKYFTSIITHKR